MIEHNNLTLAQTSAGAPVTQFMVRTLFDNLFAFAEKHALCPKLAAGYIEQSMLDANVDSRLLDGGRIQQAHFSPNVVSQSALKTASFSINGVAQSSTFASNTVVLSHPAGSSGAAYDLSLGPQINSQGGGASLTFAPVGYVLSAVAVPNLNPSPGQSTIVSGHLNVTWSGQYITASKPYSLDGENEIEWFVFVKIKDGIIVAISVAEDPPWAHNGPTITTPDGYFGVEPNQNYDPNDPGSEPMLPPEGPTGKPYKLVSSLAGQDIIGALSDPASRQAAAQAIQNRTFTKVAIDYDYKNKDMAEYPHPFFADDDLADSEIFMADYLSPIMLTLGPAATASDIQNLINQGVLGFTDTVNRPGPPGVTLKTIDFI